MALEQEMHSIGGVSPKGANSGAAPAHPADIDADRVLLRLGKKQFLKRNTGLISMTGFACSLMCTWEGAVIDFFLGYQNGGPAGLVYSLIFCWAGTLSVFIVIGELSSMAPTAGGQYHWVSCLSPPRARRYLSYITGWLTVAGWIAAFAVTSFGVSSPIQNLAAEAQENYSPKRWQGTLIYWGLLLACVGINTIFSAALPFIEFLILILNILAFFAILLPVVYLSPHVTADKVFTNFLNEGCWSTKTLAVFIGINGNAAAFLGTDGAVHMSEEVHNAPINVARAMVTSVIINGALAFGILLALLFCDVNLDSVSSELFPVIEILARGTQSTTLAIVMLTLVAVLQFCASVGSLAASSRMIWSFARDRGLPYWTKLSRVDTRMTIPLTAIATSFCIAALLGLINIGSTEVFNDLVSLQLEALYASYLIAASLLLYHRTRGNIYERSRLRYSAIPETLSWGPWRVPGILGILNNSCACASLVIFCFFSFWPTSSPTTAKTMNYSSLVTGAVVIFNTLYYFLRARRIYQGPIVETGP